MQIKREIKLVLSVEEANLILDALDNQPFNQVFALISKIQQQAASQLNPMQEEKEQ